MFIGISLRNEKDYLYINNSYLNCLNKLGVIPVIITNDNVDYLMKLCDGFILPGGNKFYDADKKVIRYCIDKDIPLLGICLGMQELCCYFSNYKDYTIKNINNDHKSNEIYVHPIRIKKKTRIYKIVKKKEIWVNSRHNYHVINNDNILVSSKSKDGIIESIEVSNKRFIIGVQWHPEDMIEYDVNQYKLFKAFIGECTLK